VIDVEERKKGLQAAFFHLSGLSIEDAEYMVERIDALICARLRQPDIDRERVASEGVEWSCAACGNEVYREQGVFRICQKCGRSHF
jgi:hypothetical protein